MRAEYLNIFTKSITLIFESMICERPEMGRLSARMAYPYLIENMAVYFSVSGDISGHIIITADKGCMLKIAAKMLEEDGMGEEVDEYIRSTIGEFGNMIVANATIGLADNGFACDITPPIIIMDKTAKVLCPPEIKTLVIPFEFSFGGIEVNIALSENRNGEALEAVAGAGNKVGFACM